MRLRIVTPLSVVLDTRIDSLRGEDASGGFGILSGHAPFLTALTVSIVSWRRGRTEGFCALRGGVLSVRDGARIDIASREAVTGDHLSTLDREVLARFRSEADAERVENVESLRLQMHAIRQMISRLSAGARTETFR